MILTEDRSCTAFLGERRLASGTPWDVALAVKKAGGDSGAILVFDDRTGRQIDFDLRGSDGEIIERLRGTPDGVPANGRPRGRPRLGVTAREVTLLPRHWEWLSAQPEGASATIRRLVDTARAEGAEGGRAREAQAAADRFMMAMLGNQPGWEEASRALYAGDRARFHGLTEGWPTDLRDHARRLAEPALIRG